MSPIIVALDFPTLEEARALAGQVSDHVAGFKVGLELLTGVGPRAIEAIADLGKPVFADAKLHDIPNTVESAARRIADAGARWVTVHASGGSDMMRAAVVAMGTEGVLAVTVLTSLTSSDLEETGVTKSPTEQVLRLAALGEAAGVEGLVCSPEEVGALRGSGVALSLFTPGIRLPGHERDDQKRVATPQLASAAGADYLVIGRSITRAEHPAVVAREIASSLQPPAEDSRS